MKCFLDIPDFLQEISTLSHSTVFFYFFALFTWKDFLISLLFSGTLHSDGYIFPFFPCLSLLFFSQLFVRPPLLLLLLSCNSVQPHRQQPTRLLCPRDSLGKNTGVGCRFLLHRQPFCLFAFPFLGDGFDYRLLYNVMNLGPLQALYQI